MTMPQQTNHARRRAKLRAAPSWVSLALSALMLPSCAEKTVSYERFREMKPFQGILVRYAELEKEPGTPVHSNSGPDVLVVVKDAEGITYTIPRIHTHGGAARMLDALQVRRQCDFPADLIACEDRILYGPLKHDREHPEPPRQPPSRTAGDAAGLTIEMFKPYLTERHNINDVMRVFAKPDFFNAGGAFTWATYKLSDGTILVVGEHIKPSATLRSANGEVIRQFPFGGSTSQPGRPVRAIRFTPDPNRSVAYLTGVQAEVYLVADDKVIQLVAPLVQADARGPVEFRPAKDKSEAWLFEGKEVSKYVLPRGVARLPRVPPALPGEPPPKPLYAEQKASAGAFSMTNLPARMSFRYGGVTEVKVNGLSFPSGVITDFDVSNLEFEALPP